MGLGAGRPSRVAYGAGMIPAPEAVDLADGRTLDVLLGGATDGTPLVLHHGTPSCAALLPGCVAVASVAGARLPGCQRRAVPDGQGRRDHRGVRRARPAGGQGRAGRGLCRGVGGEHATGTPARFRRLGRRRTWCPSSTAGGWSRRSLAPRCGSWMVTVTCRSSPHSAVRSSTTWCGRLRGSVNRGRAHLRGRRRNRAGSAPWT